MQVTLTGANPHNNIGLLPRKLVSNLPPQAASQAPLIVSSVTVAAGFPWGSPERIAINNSFTSVFQTMVLVGLILVAIAFVSSILIQDHDISEVDARRKYKGVVIGKTGALNVVKGKSETDSSETN